MAFGIKRCHEFIPVLGGARGKLLSTGEVKANTLEFVRQSHWKIPHVVRVRHNIAQAGPTLFDLDQTRFTAYAGITNERP